MPAIDLRDVQRIIVRTIPLPRVRHYLLKVAQPDAARRFLSSLTVHVTPATEGRVNSVTAVALTYPGLAALELPDQHLGTFRRVAPAFAEGAATRAAQFLGDTGRNESQRWEPALRSNDTHVLLTLYADDEAALEHNVGRLHDGKLTATGLRGWEKPLIGARLGNTGAPTEPFGFRDGISQPTIAGVHLDWMQRNPPAMHVKPGEFLLGHPNEDDANRWLGADVPASVQTFVRNGSFVALRKMRQNVAAFGKVPPWIQAKMCGRWPNGAVVREGETAQPTQAPTPESINKFEFGSQMSELGCPYASHIRRLNPRNDAISAPRKRLLMRRGTPYSDGDEVGLLGLFVCADLERQFEFLVGAWTREAPMLPGNRAPDPLIGSRGGAATKFPIPSAQGIEQVELADYITTRGTLYGFYPGLAALGKIKDRV